MGSFAFLEEWFSKRQEEIRADFFRFLAFPSISADPSYAGQVRACASWLSEFLHKKGLGGRLVETSAYPLVMGELRSLKSDAPTVLFYGHYDVQPVDPLSLWKSDPFVPLERDGKIYARGASDNKGQIFYALLAMAACKELGIALPVHVKFCIEGEEESQSRGLKEALPKLQQELKADALLVIDFDSPEKEPALSLGARGMAGMEITVTGSNTDLHSGILGGAAYNPNRALVEMLASLWDADGKVQVPGFYDDVVEEKADLYHFSSTEEDFTRAFGIRAFGGEKGRSLKEAVWLRPALEINGMGGGYSGEGIKTVIPAKAFAKLTMRLVPQQNPEKILAALSRFLEEKAPAGFGLSIESSGGEKAWRGRPDSPLAKAVAQAASEVCHAPCRNVLCGASIPIVADLLETIKTDVVGMGYALDTDQIHAPNEHFDMPRLKKGFLTVARAMMLYK